MIKASKSRVLIASWLGLFLVVGIQCSLARGAEPVRSKWRALHLINYETDAQLNALAKLIPKLAEAGVNVLILEIDYNFEFQSHPELRRGDRPITKRAATSFASVCRRNHVRLIPEFQCVGHQSIETETLPLLKTYPELDMTPGAFPDNKGIYCREWNPLNPRVNKIVLPLMDEIIDAFHADAMHVGMDEIFLIGSEQSPATHGKEPAQVFAKTVNDIHAHLVREKHIEMLMWGDRLFDADKYHWGEWEASRNGTAAAVDLIPRDVIVCPWHYDKSDSYPSIPMFIAKGFRVLPASWRDMEATSALIDYELTIDSPKLLGHVFTVWGAAKDGPLSYSPLIEGLKLLNGAPQAIHE